MDGDDIEDFDVPLHEWIAQAKVERQIKMRFARFLNTFTLGSGEKVYPRRIDELCSSAHTRSGAGRAALPLSRLPRLTRARPSCADNKQSLEVSYLHLSHFEPVLAIWVADAPAQVLPIFHAAARAEVHKRFRAYDAIQRDLFVRIAGLPIGDTIRDLRQTHLNGLIKVSGVVACRTGVFPQLQSVTYDCTECGAIFGPLLRSAEAAAAPPCCPQCRSAGLPFPAEVEQTLYRNYARLTLQEHPGSVPAGRLPRFKDVILLHDLVDCAQPGDAVEVTGIYKSVADTRLSAAAGFPVFGTEVEANHVRVVAAAGADAPAA